MLVTTLVGIIVFVMLSDLAAQNKTHSASQQRNRLVTMSDLENPGVDWLGTWAK